MQTQLPDAATLEHSRQRMTVAEQQERGVARLLGQRRPVPRINAFPASSAELNARVAAWLDLRCVEKMKLALEGWR